MEKIKIKYNENTDEYYIVDGSKKIIWEKHHSDILKMTGDGKSDEIFLDKNNFRIKALFSYDISNIRKYIPEGVKLINSNTLFIPFQFFSDVSIQERSPSYSEKNILSRFEPLSIWQSSGRLEVSLKLTYYAIDETHNEVWVNQMANLLRALSLPEYKGVESFFPPPRISLKVGNLVDNIPCNIMSTKREFDGGFTIPENDLYDNIFLQTKQVDKKRNVYLPKKQSISLTFLSQYTRKFNERVDFFKIVKNEEGITRLRV